MMTGIPNTKEFIFRHITEDPQTTKEISSQCGICAKTAENNLKVLQGEGKVMCIKERFKGRYRYIQKWRLVIASDHLLNGENSLSVKVTNEP